ncbi:helix-turn-helix domain-containing protein [Methylobacterium tarhaniae]|uniref:helix-turn-helix domain-containing protein n=1 Tax=Methylobacterium tarhaniae TaxID=1187852 RepID=UPI001FDA42A3|nr:AraC family transcriptional regulator [Methylobacterium tarhaniae]
MAEWPDMRIERRTIQAGSQSDLTLECTEIVMTIAGRSAVQRTGNGNKQQSLARPGVAWVCPIGTVEREIVLSEPISTLHIYLPQKLLGERALEDYGLNPGCTELAYVGGFVDPKLNLIGTSLAKLLDEELGPADRLFADGMRVALVARLLASYTADRRTRSAQAPALGRARLKRVLEYIDAHLGDELTLDRLAEEARLSAYHFSRLFRDATGLPPHRYVTLKRIEAAQEQITLGRRSLVDIALGTGFGSQNNFTRAFRKATGLTPGQYRELRRKG